MLIDNIGIIIFINFKFFLYVFEYKVKLVEFEVKDKFGKSFYFMELNIFIIFGIVKLILLENVFLKINKEYIWIFVIVCDFLDCGIDNLVQGIIKKVEISLELENSLKNVIFFE